MLHPSPLAEAPDVLALNLMMGCAQRCAFCSARAYTSYPGDEVVYLYSNTVERLEEEIKRRRHKPRAVYLSPSTDPFPPLAEIQRETVRVVEFLAEHGIESWLMTRGLIRPSALKALAARREFVRVTVGITTLDRHLQRVLEPLTAPPRLRLRQIAQLKKLGIPVRVAVEPLVPTLTDTRDNLEELLAGLAAAGVKQLTTGYMFLRPGIRDNLIKALAVHGWDQQVLGAFTHGKILEGNGIAPARYLSKVMRQHTYATMMALAAPLGITVRVSDITNPDFRPPRRLEIPVIPRQPLLPMF